MEDKNDSLPEEGVSPPRSLPTRSRLLALLMISPLAAEVGKNQGAKNPNRATSDELLALPSIDPSTAERILVGRPYLTMTALDERLGDTLSAEQKEALNKVLFVPINLNTASRQEILLVPRIGPRMAHEFEEYRPYRAMAQWRREIGKYVDDDEVARLERYVTLESSSP